MHRSNDYDNDFGEFDNSDERKLDGPAAMRHMSAGKSHKDNRIKGRKRHSAAGKHHRQDEPWSPYDEFDYADYDGDEIEFTSDLTIDRY